MPTSPMEVTDAASRDAAQTSLRCTLQVWDLPEAVPPGEHFEFTVGVKAADGRCLAGWWVGLFQGNSGIGDRSDTDAPPIRQAPLQALPWPGSEALYWAKLQACSPSLTAAADDSQLASASPQAAVTQGWAVRLLPMPHPARSDLSGAALDLSTAVCEFSLPQSPATQHVLTLQVIDESDGTALPGVLVRVGPWRCETDNQGRASLQLAAGRQTVMLWKSGYAAPVSSISIDPDTAMPVRYQVAMRPELEANPDDNWTA